MRTNQIFLGYFFPTIITFIVFNGIKNRKHIVTANKSLISKYGNELSKLAESNKVNLEFEAAVAGGVPIIRVLKEGLITNKINDSYCKKTN